MNLFTCILYPLKEKKQKVFNRIISVRMFLTVLIISSSFSVLASEKEPLSNEISGRKIEIKGRVLDEKGVGVAGVNVRVKKTDKVIKTNSSGDFVIDIPDIGSVLQFSFIGYEAAEYVVKDRSTVNITLKQVTAQLEEVGVVSTGYQKLNQERSTGSFVHIDNKLLNRSFSTDILSRLDGVASGVLFNKSVNRMGGGASNGGDPGISIRGRSTINSNTEPLIVLDNFPYEGNPDDINPNDVESITILKDAAAASIWGVRAGNGVIVITTKKGRYGQPPKITLTSNLTVSDKTDLYAVPQLSSAEYIDRETWLFNQGNFDNSLERNPHLPQSPVVDILDKQKRSLITADEANKQLDVLRGIDSRQEYTRHFLRNAIKQQYALNIQGGGANQQYYISGGFDKSRGGRIVDGSDNRVTLNMGNTFRFFKERLELNTSVMMSKTASRSPLTSFSLSRPYEQLADADGNALSVIKDYRQEFKETAGNGLLLDWNLRPLEELHDRGRQYKTTTYRVNVGLNYKIVKGLQAQLSYQYADERSENESLYDKSSYYVRNLINTTSRLVDGKLVRSLPYGDIFESAYGNGQQQYWRGQLAYANIFNEKHEVNAIMGAEIRTSDLLQKTLPTLYGYNKETGIYTVVDYLKDYPTFIGGNTRVSNDNMSVFGRADRFISVYANAAYTYNQKYTVSGSIRKDESNLFGVDANKKGVPLWSAGVAWNIAREDFYHTDILPVLRIRGTYGYSGNVNTTVSAYVTARVANLTAYNETSFSVVNPPNASLSWERVSNLNLAVDFGFKNNIVSGSLEVFNKKGMDLIGSSLLPPQTGVTQFIGNNASIQTKGVDVIINTINLKRKLTWQSSFLLSYVKDKVIAYQSQPKSNSERLTSSSSLEIGKPYSGLYSYKWGGLDSNGDPQTYLNGELSKDYRTINNNNDVNQMIYHGSGTPTVSGALRNSFGFLDLDFSFNIVYKFGYYFRRGDYYNGDYQNRWMKPGDEHLTNVPARIYPANSLRESLYSGAEIFVDKGDHIRLEDFQIGYTLSKKENGRLPFSQVRLNANVSNTNIVFWRANKLGLDPSYVGGGSYLSPTPTNWSIGLTANF